MNVGMGLSPIWRGVKGKISLEALGWVKYRKMELKN